MMAMLYEPTSEWTARIINRSSPAEYCPAPTYSTLFFFNVGDVGTGGVMSVRFCHDRAGYPTFVIADFTRRSVERAEPRFVAWMGDVKAGFGRTMSSLPQIFGVSRQTLYNWLRGEEPREMHQGKLEQLAAAAREFRAIGFKPTSNALTRTLARGRTFLQLIAEGADGVATAKALERLVIRGRESRAALDALLGDRKATPTIASDLGQPSFREDM